MLCEVINKISIILYDKPFPYFHIAHCISFGNVAVGTSFSSLVFDSQVSFRFKRKSTKENSVDSRGTHDSCIVLVYRWDA